MALHLPWRAVEICVAASGTGVVSGAVTGKGSQAGG